MFAESLNENIQPLAITGKREMSYLIMHFCSSLLIQLPWFPPGSQFQEVKGEGATEGSRGQSTGIQVKPLLACSCPSEVVPRAARHVLRSCKLVRALPALPVRI